jgi:hypothetical protein
MNAFGWTFMLLSISFVLTLISCCFYKVLTSSSAVDNLHSPVDIDTRDLNT